MKKLFGLILIVMLAFTACEGKMGPPGKDGQSTEWFVCDFEVDHNDWAVVSEDDWYFFEYEFKVPELTKSVFKDGATVCYLSQEVTYDNGRTYNRIHCLLPHTVYGEYEDGTAYSENYSCELREGYINFVVKYSDISPDLKPPSSRFHVVMMW